MNEQIRRLEHRAEQLAVRFEELADRPDTTRIALTGIFTTVGLCWFAVAWGEGLLLLGLPLVAVGCIIASKARQPQDDPAVEDEDHDLGSAGTEIDAWLTRITAKPPLPLPEPDESRAAFTAPAPSFEAPLLPPPSPQPQRQQPLEMVVTDHQETPLEETNAEPVSTTSIYEVAEIRAGGRVLLEVRATFDAAVDTAFELIQERDPPELEIALVRGEERETAWSYNREDAEGQPRGSLDLFGFDATRWAARR